MLTPQDPDAFRAKVLRRAVQLERRRHRARLLMAIPALVAVVLVGILATQNGSSPTTVAVGDGAGVITSEVVDLPGDGEAWSVVGGTDGAMWVLSHGNPAALTRITGDAEPETFPLPSGVEPDAIVAGTDEAIWMTDPARSEVLRVGPDGTVTTWPTDASPSPSATWLGGRFWFAEPSLDRITGISTAGDVNHLDVPPGRAPTVVATGPDGAVWFASSTAARIGSVSSSGTVNELDLGKSDERALAMTSGPGPALWLVIASPSGNRLAHVDAQANVVGEDIVATPPPSAISLGPDGRIWFAAGDGTIHSQSTSKLTVRQLGRPLFADSWALARDDSMWAVDRAQHVLLRIVID